MAKTPEGKVKDGVKKFLKERGAWFFMPVSNGMGQVGIPDIIICYKGVFVAIETKAPGKKANVTANQERVMNEIRLNGGFAFVVDSIDELKLLFDSIDVFKKLA
jgi:Holliday junction resolvase